MEYRIVKKMFNGFERWKVKQELKEMSTMGVNDRNKHRFEGRCIVLSGVSYNSYLIDDEMVALVDTVDICYFEVHLRKSNPE